MKVWVTREQVIEALLTEPNLSAGSWIRVAEYRPHNPRTKARDPACVVCAVGAVLRRCMERDVLAINLAPAAQGIVYAERSVADRPDSFEQEAQYLVSTGHYLNALSVYFEGKFREACIWRNVPTDEEMVPIRAACADFVRGWFPDRLQIDLGRAAPAVDVYPVEGT